VIPEDKPTQATSGCPGGRRSATGADMGSISIGPNIATFLTFFYTDVFGISAAAAGSMLFAIKLVNAFTDPMIGAVADRTTTRFGKFRPYLVWMALPLAVAGVLTYTTPNLEETASSWAYGPTCS